MTTYDQWRLCFHDVLLSKCEECRPKPERTFTLAQVEAAFHRANAAPVLLIQPSARWLELFRAALEDA